MKHTFKRKGKYAIINPCYACGKSAGEDYWSHPKTDEDDWNDIAICLCEECYSATMDMTTVNEFREYKKQFGDASEKAWDRAIKERDSK